MKRRLVACLSFFAFFAWALDAAAQAPAAERLYAVEIRTGPAWLSDKPPQEQTHFRAHSQHLAKLRADGVIVFGARYGEKGFIVLRLPNIESARAALDEDPSMRAGTFVYEMHEMRVFYPGTLGGAPR